MDLGLSRDVDTLSGNNNLIRFIKLGHTQSMCNIPCRCTSSFKRVLSLKNTVHDSKLTCPARKRSQYKANRETSCRRRDSLLCFIREPPYERRLRFPRNVKGKSLMQPTSGRRNCLYTLYIFTLHACIRWRLLCEFFGFLRSLPLVLFQFMVLLRSESIHSTLSKFGVLAWVISRL